MRAKLINEIKQNKEITGLGSIGIGNYEVLKSYFILNEKWPDWFNKDAKKLDIVMDEIYNDVKIQKYKDRIKYYIEELEVTTMNPLENFICINMLPNSDNEFKETDEIFLDMFDYDNNSYELFDDEFNNGFKVTFSSKITYSRKYKFGLLYINDIYINDISGKAYYYIYVKYK